MKKTEKVLLDLLKSLLFNRAIDILIFDDITPKDWRQVHTLAERQGISAIVFDAIDKQLKKGVKISLPFEFKLD
ncbi:hypothetical protein SAMN05216253_103201 [Bacteroides thetaiotaomicron]|uniref:hypothetical protein n=1 Tax=Bacteroides thetaiotaomicron TaxID=818 RepID=UPI00089FB033|nr:hypothetical protein [Bacteroides thetaiotaomicron]MBS5446943.1 hypothetical protein [Bacteroides thetaiotaomicron]SEF82089.1 hypothetical protein SAMN05216253_103201 [Bacteroides thetaiotaomicron]